MRKSACVPDGATSVKTPSLPIGEILSDIGRSNPVLLCPPKYLTAFTDLWNGRRQKDAAETCSVFSFCYFFSLFYLLTFRQPASTEPASAAIQMLTCDRAGSRSGLQQPFKERSAPGTLFSTLCICSAEPRATSQAQKRKFQRQEQLMPFNTQVTNIAKLL